MKIQQKIHPLTITSHSTRSAKKRIWKELNEWSKEVAGISFPMLLLLFAAVEYIISLMPQK